MYKIAILGCENSHAEGFLKIIQQDYPDVQVLGVHSEYPGEAEKLQEIQDTFNCDYATASLYWKVVNGSKGYK